MNSYLYSKTKFHTCGELKIKYCIVALNRKQNSGKVMYNKYNTMNHINQTYCACMQLNFKCLYTGKQISIYRNNYDESLHPK